MGRELRLQFTWVPGTPWQGASQVGLLALGADVNAWESSHNLHHCFLPLHEQNVSLGEIRVRGDQRVNLVAVATQLALTALDLESVSDF